MADEQNQAQNNQQDVPPEPAQDASPESSQGTDAIPESSQEPE